MRLSALQSASGRISLLQLDNCVDLADGLDLDTNLQAGQTQFAQILTELVSSLGEHPTGLVVDAAHSFPIVSDLQVKRPLVINLTQPTTNLDPTALPALHPQWGVDEVANNYAVATLTLWYHPAEPQALEKKKIVAELFDYCHHLQIDLLLQLNIYHLADEAKTPEIFHENQLTAVQEFRSMSNALVLQYPQDALAAATLTAELDQPWVVALAPVEYEQAKHQLRTALENGAAGFLAGELFWQEIAKLKQPDESLDLSAIKAFIQTTARDRLLELTRIADEYSP